MADGILPFLGVVTIERKPLCDELVDPSQSEFAVRRVGNGHGDQGDVAVWWFASLKGPLPPASSLRLCSLTVIHRKSGFRGRIALHFNHRHDSS